MWRVVTPMNIYELGMLIGFVVFMLILGGIGVFLGWCIDNVKPLNKLKGGDD